MSWRINVYDGYTQIFPENDLKEHSEEVVNHIGMIVPLCKCEPRIDYNDKQLLFIHSSYDGRECMEEVNELLGT